MPQIEKQTLENWLKEQADKFQEYLNGVRKNKLKALSPKVQGQTMASAGCIAFIKAELEYLDTLKCDLGHELEEKEK